MFVGASAGLQEHNYIYKKRYHLKNSLAYLPETSLILILQFLNFEK